MNINDISSSSSSTSSIYGSRNVISGLASGMDTEAIIKNSVSGYQTKIDSLEKEKTTVEWKQEAYRSIIDKMNAFADKYTSFTSTTNLNSNAFYNNYTTTASGSNAGKVYATGHSDNDVQINSISQLATGKTLRVSLGEMVSGAKSTSTLSELGLVNGGSLTVNGVDLGPFDGDTKLSTVISAINSKTDAKASFSNVTGELMITSKDTGADAALSLSGSIASSLFTTDEAAMSRRTLGDVLGSDFEWGPNDMGILRIDTQNGESREYTVEKSTNLKDLMDNINGNSSADGLSVSFQNGQFTFSDSSVGVRLIGKNTENAFRGSIGDVLKSTVSLTDGQDAKLNVTVNGRSTTITQSSNTVDLDGLKVTLKGTFDSGDAIGLDSKVNTEPIVSAIKSFIDDYNAIQNELHSAYTTQPLEKSGTSHGKYEPLSDSDKEGMSESSIAAYEKKAKTGLLYMDSDLSAAYERMRNAITDGGTEKALSDIGITVKYSNYTTTLELDESKLKDALETDMDSVKKVFMGEEDKNKGMISSMQATVKTYANTSSGSRGVLVQKAGTEKNSSSLLDNDLQKKYNQLEEKIQEWQTKMNTKIDYYTSQFTALEKMISQMNNQSSMLAGLTGA